MKYFLYFFILFFSSISPVLSASFSIDPENKTEEYRVGDEIIFEANLDTNEKYYNAIQGEVIVDERFSIKQVITGGSIISAWIENPSNAKNNTVDFSGIVAGGYKGKGTLFKLLLIPKEKGDLNIQTINSFTYLNDGQGTEEKILDNSYTFSVRDLYENELNIKINSQDKIPPEKFEVLLVRDKNMSDGKYVLVFEATDKGSGVKTYEVLEGKNLFKQARSPYVLVNQKINERIYVKAIDYSGNERVVKVNIEKKVCIANKCFKEKIAMLALLGLFLLSFILWRKQSKDFKKISEIVS